MTWVGAGRLALVGLVAVVTAAPGPRAGEQAAKSVTVANTVAAKYGHASN